MRTLSFLLALTLLTSCSLPTYKLDEEPTTETFECSGYFEEFQYYYNAVFFENESILVSGAISDELSSSSGTHLYAPGETLSPVMVYKEKWVGMNLVLLPKIGIQFSSVGESWTQFDVCYHER